jgi:hypothetical protein
VPALEILCLANSRKLRGRCVAGLRTDGQGWIRPVGPALDGTLYPRHYTLDDGTEAQVLDVLRIDIASPRPEPHQPENWLISNMPWYLRARPAPRSCLPILRAHIVRGPDLLGNQLDRVRASSFSQTPAQASLALVIPNALEWHITTSMLFGRRQTRARFVLGSVLYDLSVTDPVWEQHLRSLSLGVHPITSARKPADVKVLLTVSLGEPFGGDCYKLVAAVIVVPRLWRNQL